jgi:hypothetical protein
MVNRQRPAFQNQPDEQESSRIQISEFRGAAGNGAEKPARARPARTSQNKESIHHRCFGKLYGHGAMRMGWWLGSALDSSIGPAQHKTGLVILFFKFRPEC